MARKKVLIVSSCGKRRNTIGLIGELLSTLSNLDKEKYEISLLDTNFFEQNHNPNDYIVDNYFSLKHHWYDSIVRLIPQYRAKYANQVAVTTFRSLLNKKNYDYIVVFQIPTYAHHLVTIAHERKAKIIFEPFGSDILRVSGNDKENLYKAFSEVDAVCGRDKSGTVNAAKDVYHVPGNKIKIQMAYCRGVKNLMELKDKLSRAEMMANLCMPYSGYNIVCGYSGRKSHRHKVIIEALIQVKEVLPDGYQIVFPMTYGAGAHHEIIIEYAKQLKELCDAEGLHSYFLTNFMTDDQMAYLHLITDLFIEIQPTDNGNGFMIEALYAENQIVTGRWLKYERFEQFGVPYHLIDTPEELPRKLRDIFTHQVENAKVPQALLEYLRIPDNYDSSNFWEKLFESMK